MSRKQRNALAETIERLTRELAESRTIIAGSDVPPTEAEIAAHAASGGWWRMVASGPIRRMTGRGAPTYYEMIPGEALPKLMEAYADGSPRCWPLDADGRLCARPVVTK